MEKKKILLSIANETGAYLPVLEVELPEETIPSLIEDLQEMARRSDEPPAEEAEILPVE